MNTPADANIPVAEKNPTISWSIPAFCLVLTLCLVAGLGYVLVTGKRIESVHVPLSDVVMQMEHEATLGHLWLEEVLAGDREESAQSALDNLALALSYAQTMRNGGTAGEWTVTPLDDPEYNRRLERLIGQLTQLHILGIHRVATHAIEDAGAGTLSDHRFDAAFSQFQTTWHQMDDWLHHALDSRLAAFQKIQSWLMGLSLMLGLATAALMLRFEAHRVASYTAVLTANRKAKEASKRRLETVFRAAPDCIFILDEHDHVVSMNNCTQTTFGYPSQEAMGKTIGELIMPPEGIIPNSQGDIADQLSQLGDCYQNGHQEVTAKRKDGATFPAELSLSPIPQGDTREFVGIMHDISERKRLQERLEKLATRDALTQLSNRRHLDEQLDHEFLRAVRYYDQPLSVLLIDVDHFKKCNDTYGHQGGDAVLVALGQLLSGSIRKVDIAGRYGGEELMVVLPQTELDQALTFAERIRQQIADIVVVHDGHDITITVSIGVASVASSGATTTKALVQAADQALYQAKDGGRNQVVASSGAKAA
jgi:diguanylate cyclase (GGDEF)-like protein/PAS domain S-box-containing protein